MKRIIFLLAVFFTISAHAQIESHVRWAYGAKKINSKEAVVFLKATIDDDWHIYSLNVKNGPIPTSFTFTPSKEYTLVGKVTAPAPIEYFDKNFNVKVGYYEKSVIFQQKIKLKSANVSAVKGKLEFTTCNAKKCLPSEDVEFTIPLAK